MVTAVRYPVSIMDELTISGELALPAEERRKQIRVIYAYLLVAFSYFALFPPVYAFVFHQIWMAYIHVASAVLCLLIIIIFWRTKNNFVASFGVSILATIIVLAMALLRSPPDGATYGVFGASVFVFFILPRAYYIGLVAVMTATFVVALILSLLGVVHLLYTEIDYFILIVSLVFDNSLLVLFGREKAKVDRKLNTSLKEIRKLAHELETENERVEAEVKVRTEEYRKEHAKLETSIESLRIGFMLLDQDMAVVSVNKAAMKVLVSRSADYQGRSLPTTLTLDEVVVLFTGSFQFVARVEASMKSKRQFNVHDLRFGDRFLAISITPVIEDNAAVGAVVLVEDTTDTKAMERSREEFFSIASHELRTPLTSIVGNSTMALQYYKQLDEKQTKEMLEDISSAGKRLIAIVNDFLDMSRLEQGGVAIQAQPVSANTIVHEVLHELEKLAHDKQIALRFAKPPKPAAYVLADQGRLKQVLINLVGNAIKYTDQGEVVVSVHERTANTDIVVQDTGRGIPTESQYLLFRKFQQASDNILTRDNSQSTGLGLYISKMIAKAMKGDVYLEKSAPNEGSTFVVTLPTAHK